MPTECRLEVEVLRFNDGGFELEPTDELRSNEEELREEVTQFEGDVDCWLTDARREDEDLDECRLGPLGEEGPILERTERVRWGGDIS